MKKLLLSLVVFLLCGSVNAAQQPVTVGTAGTPADLDANFSNTHSNFTELYTAKAKAVETWNDATSYPLGKQVVNDLIIYTCTAGHLSSTDTEPGTGVSWGTAWVLTGHLLSAANLSKLANVPDDTNADINPGETDICGNGIAEDCVADVACSGARTHFAGWVLPTSGTGIVGPTQ